MSALEAVPGGSHSITPVAIDALRLGKRVALITDFLDEEAEHTSGSTLLKHTRTAAAAGHEIYALHIVEQLELHPDARQLLVADPEQPDLRRPMPASARAAYAQRFGEWRERLAHDWRSAGAVYEMAVPGTEPLRRTIRRITAAGEKGGFTR